MKYRVEGPDGTTHVLEADSEAALHDAVEELWGEPKEPEPEKPDHMPAVVELLERIANRPDPEFPKAEPIDFGPIERAVGKLKPAEIEPVLWKHAKEIGFHLEQQTRELTGDIGSLRLEVANLRKDLLEAIQRLQGAMLAPRELIRDRQGRALRSEVVT